MVAPKEGLKGAQFAWLKEGSKNTGLPFSGRDR